MVYIKTDDIYKHIAGDVETKNDTSNYELECNSIERTSLKGKNKKVIGLMKDNLGRKIMIKFVGSGAKSYSYLIDDASEDKKEYSIFIYFIEYSNNMVDIHKNIED